MKAILISIKPKWVAKILNGEKTIEIRKNMPKCGLPIDVYIYATKEEKLYDDYPNMANGRFKNNKVYKGKHNISGKVVAKFTLNKVEEVFVGEENNDYFYKTKHLANKKLRNKSCLNDKELLDYLNLEKGYAWHIDDLEIFDKPKEISEFRHYKRFDCYNADFDYTTIEYRKIRLTKAPQSWCYVEVTDEV